MQRKDRTKPPGQQLMAATSLVVLFYLLFLLKCLAHLSGDAEGSIPESGSYSQHRQKEIPNLQMLECSPVTPGPHFFLITWTYF
jgi:hypothetical protein